MVRIELVEPSHHRLDGPDDDERETVLTSVGHRHITSEDHLVGRRKGLPVLGHLHCGFEPDGLAQLVDGLFDELLSVGQDQNPAAMIGGPTRNGREYDGLACSGRQHEQRRPDLAQRIVDRRARGGLVGPQIHGASLCGPGKIRKKKNDAAGLPFPPGEIYSEGMLVKKLAGRVASSSALDQLALGPVPELERAAVAIARASVFSLRDVYQALLWHRSAGHPDVSVDLFLLVTRRLLKLGVSPSPSGVLWRCTKRRP